MSKRVKKKPATAKRTRKKPRTKSAAKAAARKSNETESLESYIQSKVKDLNKNADIIADQSYSERQLFEKAYERLKSEFEAVLKTGPEEVQKKMDKALGRSKISEELQ